MSFSNFNEFLAMGGHGLYVWLCYGVGLAVLAGNYLLAGQARRQTLRQLAQRQRREELRQQEVNGSERESEA